MPHTLFISDLHLCTSRPQINDTFFKFLDTIVPHAEALYVLGDLFEYWPGDDDLTDPLHTEVAARFSHLNALGVKLYLMHGNRDFLMGKVFCEATGMTLIPDPSTIDLYATPTLLMHGDTLCTDDVHYQTFRTQVRSSDWQRAFLGKPLIERKTLIEEMRSKSKQAQAEKTLDIMDVNQQSVVDALRQHHYPRLIHGHTHRPAKHIHVIDNHPCERWVLTDWYTHGGYLRCDQTGCAMFTL